MGGVRSRLRIACWANALGPGVNVRAGAGRGGEGAGDASGISASTVLCLLSIDQRFLFFGLWAILGGESSTLEDAERDSAHYSDTDHGW